MYKMSHRFLLQLLFITLLWSPLAAQTVSKLVVTDNLAASSKFGYGKPKPAAPKEVFTILPEKGTQVLVYTELVPSDELAETYSIWFSVYLVKGGEEKWVDDRVMQVKKTASHTLTAFNLFETGEYSIKVSTHSPPKTFLATGTFKVVTAE